MRVTVFHTQFDYNLAVETGVEPIASFVFPEADSVEDALELAYRYTNNIEGSWSRVGNVDAHPSLTLHTPLLEENGQTYGHRSSMVGDLIQVEVDGAIQTYKVANCGFDRII